MMNDSTINLVLFLVLVSLVYFSDLIPAFSADSFFGSNVSVSVGDDLDLDSSSGGGSSLVSQETTYGNISSSSSSSVIEDLVSSVSDFVFSVVDFSTSSLSSNSYYTTYMSWDSSSAVMVSSLSELITALSSCQGSEPCYILLNDGTYGEFHYDKIVDTYIKAKNEQKVIFTDVYLTDVENSVFDGLRVDGGGLGFRGVAYSRVTNSLVQDSSGLGLFINGNCKNDCNEVINSEYNLFDHNTVKNAYANSIDVFISNYNIFENNFIDGTQKYVGILFNTNVKGNVVRYNKVQDTLQDCVQAKGQGDASENDGTPEASWAAGKTRMNLIYQNELYNCGLGILNNHHVQSGIVAANSVDKVGYISSNTDGNCIKQSEEAYNILLVNNEAANCRKNGFDLGDSGTVSSGVAIGNTGASYADRSVSSPVFNFDTGNNVANFPEKSIIGDFVYYRDVLTSPPSSPEHNAFYRKSDGALCLYDFFWNGKWENLASEGDC